jgi:hypothetical protein
MISPEFDSVSFLTNFSVTITLDTGTTATSVIADFVDPGVTVTLAGENVTISGVYNSIIPINWEWIDNNRVNQSGKTAPPVGSYEKITKVDSPTFLSRPCNYTINGSDVFVHTVSLSSYTVIADQLISALEGAR